MNKTVPKICQRVRAVKVRCRVHFMMLTLSAVQVNLIDTDGELLSGCLAYDYRNPADLSAGRRFNNQLLL